LACSRGEILKGKAFRATGVVLESLRELTPKGKRTFNGRKGVPVVVLQNGGRKPSPQEKKRHPQKVHLAVDKTGGITQKPTEDQKEDMSFNG